MSAAIVGAIALTLSASPAQAEERSAELRPIDDRTLRIIPAATTTSATKTPTTSVAKTSTTATSSYTVKAGDTMSAIASRNSVSTASLLKANGLGMSSIIYPGQKITIPGKTTSSSTSTAKTSTTSSTTSSAKSVSYTIKSGDTVSAIASRHGVSTSAVLKANGLSMSSTIFPGKKLSIPAATSGSASSASQSVASTTSPSTTSSSKTSTSSSAKASSYTIKAGDTMSAIASRHGVSTSALLSANGLGLSSIIYPGQKLSVPGSVSSATTSKPASSTSSTSSTASIPKLDTEQTANAKIIIKVGRQLGVSDRGIAIALGTAMQESWIRNLDWGDRDSLGLFQQRPSSGWGTPDQVRDPVRATKVFFGGANDPNGYATRGLLDIPGWQSMSFAQAAQAVQISAYPDRYAQWEKPAYAWLAALG
ncbi:LysM peptidoglycan-binding domain-containing protein (plasmid) [Coraliomargarita sp. W4R53]